MSLKNSIDTYGSVAKFFHWTIAILILSMLVFGYFLEDIPKEYSGLAYSVHKLTGLTILFLVLLRLCWVAINPKPRLPARNAFERLSELTVQYTLYVCMIAMPLVAWIGSSSGGKPPHLGNIQFALPIPPNKPLIETSFYMHNTIAIILIVFISIHFLAALFHYFVRRDNVLQRML